MGTRGRKSLASLSVIGSTGIEVVERPRPPAELSDEQQAEWRSIVNVHAADRFPRESHAMLVAHCRHVVSQRRIAQLVADHERSESFDPEHYDRLLKMQERESRCLASLAVRLGFAYSTAYEKRAPKKGQPIKPPWEG